MAKRKRKKAKKSKAKKTKKKTVARKVKRVLAAKRKKQTKRKTKAKRARRTEADMSWSEVRQSRRKKSDGRFARIRRDFDRAVNMTPKALEDWLATSESREVGTKRSERATESVGHWSGRRILEIRQKKAEDLTPADYSHMRKVIAYVKRHGAQRPDGDVKETPWRYALMNWGHDPLE